MRLIDKDRLISILEAKVDMTLGEPKKYFAHVAQMVELLPDVDATPVRHGRWILEAHDELVNYRWNVYAECSECCDEKTEIWAGFFPGCPGCIAKEAAINSAMSVKLPNFCPNCGAKMDGRC